MVTPNLKQLFTRYGILGSLRLVRDVIISKLLFSNTRIIRWPFYIRGKANISWGKNFTSGVGLRLDAFSNTSDTIIHIGDNVEINDYVHIGSIESVIIENDVLIASKVFISDHNHGSYSGDCVSSPEVSPSDRKVTSLPVKICNNVWIGENVAILPGVTIESGSIVGANSVVTKSVPKNTIVAGNPAKPQKRYSYDLNTWVKIETSV